MAVTIDSLVHCLILKRSVWHEHRRRRYRVLLLLLNSFTKQTTIYGMSSVFIPVIANAMRLVTGEVYDRREYHRWQ
jgi:hypothetical protein